MTTTYQEFASFAEHLAKRSTEIEWRNSVSRAYYAAYHQALSIADRCPPPVSGSMGMHQQLINRFKELGTKEGRNIAQSLYAMKRLRTVSDYELHNVVMQHHAHQQLSDYNALSRRIVAFARSNPPINDR